MQRIIPFIFLGIFIVLLVVGFIIFSYLLIFGALVGLVLFVLNWLREKLFPQKELKLPEKKRKGRTIDHDE